MENLHSKNQHQHNKEALPEKPEPQIISNSPLTSEDSSLHTPNLNIIDLLVSEIEISHYELKDILDIPKLQSLMENFTHLTGMVTALLDAKGNVLISTGWQDICTCYHRIHPQSAQYCTESDLFLTKNIKPGEFVAYKCKNHLWDVVTPLYIGGKHLGNIYTGQFFYEDEKIDESIFIHQADQYGFERKAYLEALHKVPRFSRSHITDAMNYLVNITEFISQIGLSNLKLSTALHIQAESEKRFRILFENSPISIWEEDFSQVKNHLDQLRTQDIQDIDQYLKKHPEIVHECSSMVRIIDINKACLALHSAANKKDLLDNLQRTFTHESYTSFQEELAAIWKGRTELVSEGIVKTLENQKRFVTIYWSVLPGYEKSYQRVLVSLVDVSARQEAEKLVNQQLEFLQKLIDTIPNPIFHKDVKGYYRGCNQAFEKFLGKKAKEIIGKTVFDISPKPIADTYYQKDKELFDHPGVQIYDYLFQYEDGSQRNVIFNKATYCNTDGKVEGLIGVIVDITELKKFQEALQKSEEQFRTIIEQSPLSMQVLTPDGWTVMINHSFEKLWGLTLNDLKDYNILEDKQLSSLGIFNLIKEGFAGTTSVIPPILYDTNQSLGKGNKKWVQGRIYAIKDENEIIKKVILVHEDINDKILVEEERNKLQAQLLQSQKLEAIGLLAGGIAHDFNNMLTVILGYGNIIDSEIEPDSPIKPHIEEILISAEISANLTRQLLAFSRKQILSPQLTDLNNLIKGIENLIKRFIGEDINFETNLYMNPLPVMVDPGQIEQVLLNLCTNARDAMPKGGNLLIQTDLVELDEPYIQAHTMGRPGQYALMIISDTGQGMDSTTQQKIFEPFYTTKALGKGTGLGLSIVYGIIKQHDGNISVYSELGKGTSFKILLPLSSDKPKIAVPVTPVSLIENNETILLVEDNEEVRNILNKILSNAGYTVMEAVDGADAIHIYVEHKDTVDMIITDMIMPHKSGKEVWDEIKAIDPTAKILLTSGYTADLISNNEALDPEMDFITKPVTPHDLLSKVREILDRPTKS